jgi:hypothetical protein
MAVTTRDPHASHHHQPRDPGPKAKTYWHSVNDMRITSSKRGFLGCALTALPLVLAENGLTPTQPIISTVFHGNANNTVKWTGGMGKWSINLMEGNDVSTLVP